jgi:hypothetical protein
MGGNSWRVRDQFVDGLGRACVLHRRRHGDGDGALGDGSPRDLLGQGSCITDEEFDEPFQVSGGTFDVNVIGLGDG